MNPKITENYTEPKFAIFISIFFGYLHFVILLLTYDTILLIESRIPVESWLGLPRILGCSGRG